MFFKLQCNLTIQGYIFKRSAILLWYIVLTLLGGDQSFPKMLAFICSGRHRDKRVWLNNIPMVEYWSRRVASPLSHSEIARFEITCYRSMAIFSRGFGRIDSFWVLNDYFPMQWSSSCVWIKPSFIIEVSTFCWRPETQNIPLIGIQLAMECLQKPI